MLVCICVHTYVHVGAHEHMCPCLEARGHSLGVFSIALYLIFETRSLTNPELTNPARLARQWATFIYQIKVYGIPISRDLLVSTSPEMESQMHCASLLHTGHVCAASTVLTEPPPQPPPIHCLPFLDGFTLYIPSWPGTCYADQTSLDFCDLPASVF